MPGASPRGGRAAGALGRLPSRISRIRRSERDRICCTLARLRPVASAISGPLSSPPKRSAMISRSRPFRVLKRTLEIGR